MPDGMLTGAKGPGPAEVNPADGRTAEGWVCGFLVHIEDAGLAATAGQPGTPGGMGPAGQGAGQGNQKEHKRADYLDSVEYLEEALGDAPVVAKPIVEK